MNSNTIDFSPSLNMTDVNRDENSTTRITTTTTTRITTTTTTMITTTPTTRITTTPTTRITTTPTTRITAPPSTSSDKVKPKKSKKNSSKKKKPKKDPNKPKRPKSSWLIFCDTRRASIKAENPELKMTDFSKKMSEEWNSMSEEDKKEFEDQAAENRKIYYEKKKAYDLSLSKDHPPLELSDEEEIIAEAAPDPTVTFEHIEELDFIIKCNKSITPNKRKKNYITFTLWEDAITINGKSWPFKEMIKNNFNFGSNWTGSEEYDIRKKTRRLIKNPEPRTWHIKKENCVFSIDEINYVLSHFVTTKIIVKNENYYK